MFFVTDLEQATEILTDDLTLHVMNIGYNIENFQRI